MRKGNALFYSALLLTGANLLLRLVSMGFQVYLSGRIGAAGIGLMQLILSVNALFFTLGSAGNRTSTTYLTADTFGRGRSGEIRAVLAGCFQYSLLWSTAAAIALWQLAPWLSESWIGVAAATPALQLCAVCLPIKCLESVVSGYFTSAGRVKTLVAVNISEQVGVIAATYILLTRWAGTDQSRICLSIIGGNGAAAAVSFLILLILCYRSLPPRQNGQHPPFRRILRTALPLALADGLRSSLNTIENLIIPKRLTLHTGTVDAMADYGIVCGMVFPVLMFPAAILISLADLLVPELSRCAAGRRMVRTHYLIRRNLRTALLFGFAAGGALFALAPALGELLYHEPAAGAYLRLYAPLVPMLYTDAIVDAMCKGLGQHAANARYNMITSFLDVAGLWILLPHLGISGYYFSFAASHLVNFCLSLHRLSRTSGIRLSLSLPIRAGFCTVLASGMTMLLPIREGVSGLLFPCLIFLLILALSWFLFRVAGTEDIHWLWGLFGGKKAPE